MGVSRGDLWTVAGGVYASKPRPALIVQADHFDDLDSVTVIPLTTTFLDAALLRVPVEATDTTGLTQPSYAMVDKLTTVRRESIHTHVGSVSSASLLAVERALIVFLGLGE